MIKKLALTAIALSMSAAFAGTQDKATSASTNSAQPGVAVESSGSKESMTSASSGNNSQVKQVQKALKEKGQDPGSIDGKMGPKTQAALQSFQQAQGLSGAGSLDSQTLTALGVSGGASASASGSITSNQPSASSNSMTSSSEPAASSTQPAASSTNSTTSSNQPAASSSNPSNANQGSSTSSTKETKQ